MGVGCGGRGWDSFKNRNISNQKANPLCKKFLSTMVALRTKLGSLCVFISLFCLSLPFSFTSTDLPKYISADRLQGAQFGLFKEWPKVFFCFFGFCPCP